MGGRFISLRSRHDKVCAAVALVVAVSMFGCSDSGTRGLVTVPTSESSLPPADPAITSVVPPTTLYYGGETLLTVHTSVTEVSAIELPQASRVAATRTEVWATADDGAVVVVDPQASAIVDRLEVPGRPTSITIGDGIAWIASDDDGVGTITAIDATSHAVVGSITVRPAPTDILATGNRVYVANSPPGFLTIIDAQTMTITAAVSVGDVVGGLAYNGQHLWMSYSAAYEESKQTVQDLGATPSSRTAAERDDGGVAAYDPATGEITQRISTAAVGTGSVLLREQTLLLTSDTKPVVFVIDITAGRVVKTITTSGYVNRLLPTFAPTQFVAVAPQSGQLVLLILSDEPGAQFPIADIPGLGEAITAFGSIWVASQNPAATFEGLIRLAPD
jgi:YVTN family beta-propeller protein